MLTRLGADTLTLDAQKIGGVRGSGVLIVPRQVEIAPLLRGGGQERGLRPGTESPALALAFASALEDIDVPMFVARAQRMREQLLSTLMHTIPSVVLNEGKDQVAHIVNLSLLGRDTDYLVALLSEAGFSVSTKSACATNEEGSRAVLALTGDPERAASTLRISWGPETKEGDLRRFAGALISSVRFMDTNGV
jgi:cysteine desulfurase